MCIVSVCGSMKQLTLCCRREPQSKPIEMLLLFGYGRSLIDQLPDIWSIRGSSSIKTKAYLVLVDAVAKIFLLFRPTQRIMTCNDPQLQLAWYLVDAVAMLFKITNPHLSFISCTVMTHYYRYVMYICGVYSNRYPGTR